MAAVKFWFSSDMGKGRGGGGGGGGGGWSWGILSMHVQDALDSLLPPGLNPYICSWKERVQGLTEARNADIMMLLNICQQKQ